MDFADPIPSGHSDSTDTQDRSVTWVQERQKSQILYLVEDRSKILKSFIDCFFLFTDPLKAIEKAHSLGYHDEGFTLNQKMLAPGIRHGYLAGDTEISVIAIEVDKDL